MRVLLTTFLFSVSSVVVASEPVVAHWPMVDYMDFLKDAPASTQLNTGGQQGVRFPMLLVFSKSGKLTWVGNPLIETADLSLATDIEPATELSDILTRLDRAGDSLGLGGLSEEEGLLPSLRVDSREPTALLVVFTLELGVCPPCDHAKEEFMNELPSHWNRFIAPVSAP